MSIIAPPSRLRATFTLGAILILGLLALLALHPKGESEAAANPMAISVFGKVPGTNLAVHITAVVPEGRSEQSVAAEVLAAQGARPFDSADFSLNGLDWDTNQAGSAAVIQNYNSANDPAGVDGGAVLALTQSAWSAVTENFMFSGGKATTRCPSLVLECGGPQVLDTFNDVTWLVLADKNTLGVTWFTTSGEPEADMALNTSFRWTTTDGAERRETGCRGPSRKCYIYDAQTVMLHENGHVAGAGHSSVSGAVMEPSYEGQRRVLQQDDMDALTALYGSGGGEGEGSATEATEVSVVRPSGIEDDAKGYATSGGRRGDKNLKVTVELEDDTGAAVSGASVAILLDLVGSPRAWNGSGTTGANGMVTFTLRNAPSGCYTTTVTSLTATGLRWVDGTPENRFCK